MKQRRDRFWRLTCSDDSHQLRWNFDVGPLPLVILSNYLSIHLWIVINRVCMQPGRPFYYTLHLEPKMDSNLTWIGPPTWLGHAYLPPKVVAKGEDVQGLPLCVLHLFEACSNLS
jgi:hypothetical protein